MVIDELWQDIAEFHGVGSDCTVVELNVAIGANAHNVAGMIRSIVRPTKRFNVMRLRIRRAIAEHDAAATYLAGVIHVSFDPASQCSVAEYTIGSYKMPFGRFWLIDVRCNRGSVTSPKEQIDAF